jgi:hypothetical protein
LIFHLVIFLIFGIDFSKLFLVYIALLIIPIRIEHRSTRSILFWSIFLYIFVLSFMLILKYYLGPYPLIFLTTFPMILLIAINFKRYRVDF